MPSVPPPPITGPLTIAPSNAAPPTFSLLHIWRWNAQSGAWEFIQWLQIGWDSWPAGYYVTSHLDLDGDVDWGPHSQVIQVVSRTMPDGTAADYVLEPPPADAAQSADCPQGFYLTDLGNQFGEPGPLCALFGSARVPACPPGTVWDPVSETCKAIVIPPIPPIPIPPPVNPLPPPPPVSPVLPGQPDPEGDEITYDLCTQMAANANAIIYAIQQLQQQQGQGGDGIDACCTAVITAIGGITSTLGLIFNLLTSSLGSNPPALDLTPVVTPLAALATSLATMAAAPPLDLTPVTAALDKIGSAIASAPGTDVSQIVAQLQKLYTTIDVPIGVYQWMADQGYISPGLLQELGTGEFGAGVVSTLEDFIKNAGVWIARFFGVTWNGHTWVLSAKGSTIADFVATFVDDALLWTAIPFYPEVRGFLDGIIKLITPTGPVTLGNVQVDPDLLITETLSPIIIWKVIAMIVGLFGVKVGDQVDKIIDKASEFAGLAEIADLKVGPLLRHGPRRIAEFTAKQTFRQELPSAGTLAGWVAQGILSPQNLQTWFEWNGLPQDFVGAVTQSAYRGFNARQMLRLIETNLFSQAEIRDELTFGGMRAVSQDRMLLAAPYLATASQRSQLIAACEAAYVEGLLSDTDLTSRVDSAENNSDRDNLILDRVKLQALTASTKELVTEYAGLFKVGIWDDPTYRANLAALGLQQWKIDLEAGKAEAAANVATFKKNLAEAAALQRATVAEERKAAMAGFKAGVLNEVTLAAALLLTGLTQAQAAAWTSLATLQQAGSLRWIYGILKSPTEAALLRQRVTALADQRKRLQIDDPTFVSSLQAMNIPDRYINALRAATDAMITPKTAAVTIPVQTT